MKYRVPHSPTSTDAHGSPTTPEFESRFAALHARGGQPLPSPERAFFESQFAHDFSRVRIHSGAEATHLADSIDAHAFTIGPSIVVGSPSYSPALLAHELTHVVQQQSTGVPRVQRQAKGYSFDELEQILPTSIDIRKILRPVRVKIPERTKFPYPDTFPERGFRFENLEKLDKENIALSFAGDLSPLPADAQKLLLENIVATVRFALDPKNPARVQELASLKKYYEKKKKPEQFFDRPADRLDSTDFYHGHVAVPLTALEKDPNLTVLRTTLYSGHGPKGAKTPNDQVQDFLATKRPPRKADDPKAEFNPETQAEAREIGKIVERHRQPYFTALSAVMAAMKKLPDAGVQYHTWEVDTPRRGGKAVNLESSNPVRELFTPFSNNTPTFYRGGKNLQTLIHFSFHVDRRTGKITLFPYASRQMVRAHEILQQSSWP